MAATEAKTTFTMPVKIIGAIGLLCSTVPTGYGESSHPVVQLMEFFGPSSWVGANWVSKKEGAKLFGQSALALAIVLQGVHYLNTK